MSTHLAIEPLISLDREPEMPKKSGTKKGEEKQREGKEKHKEGKEKQKDKISDEDEEVEGGIEDSIRRCEALLACSPLSIMPGSSCDSKRMRIVHLIQHTSWSFMRFCQPRTWNVPCLENGLVVK